MPLGLSAWSLGALIAWTLVVAGIGVYLGRMIGVGRHSHPDPEPKPVSTAADRRPAYTHPRGRHHEDTSVFAAVPPVPGPGAPSLRPPAPEVPPETEQLAAQAHPDHPLRRADDRPGVPPAPPLPGGRRRSDAPRQTRRAANRLRDGDDEGPWPPP
jgi:hypothetical protein